MRVITSSQRVQLRLNPKINSVNARVQLEPSAIILCDISNELNRIQKHALVLIIQQRHDMCQSAAFLDNPFLCIAIDCDAIVTRIRTSSMRQSMRFCILPSDVKLVST